jgi:lipopolysaccharide export system protein LptA
MRVNPRLLRRIFAGGAVIIVLTVSVFYLRGILNEKRVGNIPKVEPNIVQRTTAFTFSKSEGGRTLFTVHAAREEQLRESGRAELHDVNIVIYGRQSNRFDQIYGSDFQYDPRTGEVIAQGDVNIDLEGNSSGASQPDQAPPAEIKNPIHLKTSGLIFNHKSGLAETQKLIEFSLPEAHGSAVGATYDSRSNRLTLHSSVRVVTTEKRALTITAQQAVMTKLPSRAVLQSARVEQESRSIQADKVTVLLRPDNTIERLLGEGNVRVADAGVHGFDMTAPQGELALAGKQRIRSGVLSGGVAFQEHGPAPAHGTAQRVLLDFGDKNQVTKAHAEDSVQLSQGAPEKSMQLQADGADLFMREGRHIEQAVTSGVAKILIVQRESKTAITADRFQAAFNARNRPSSITGSSNVRTVTSTAGKPDQITSSNEITAVFNNQNAIQEAEESGDFHYQQGQQTATSDRARYRLADETITLTGSPRVQDPGGAVTAESIQLDRKTNVAVAQKDVKTTYTNFKPQPDGGMLGSSDPIHVTGTSMVANQKMGEAKFTNARLWQAANIVEAPSMVFNRDHRSLQAEGSAQDRVKCVFVQVDKNGKSVPVEATSNHLSYVDGERRAVFSGNVLVRSSETTISADTAQVFLRPRGDQSGGQLDRILAQGTIQIDQPGRKATGDQLVYTAQDDRLVLTGSPGKRPVILDAQRGQITGDSLTFYRHDDKVAVDSKENSPTVTQTRIRDASKK